LNGRESGTERSLPDELDAFAMPDHLRSTAGVGLRNAGPRPRELSLETVAAFVQVDNVEQTVKQAKQLKAKIITAPRNVDGMGKVAVIQAPSGGIFGVIAPPAAE